VGNGGHPDYEQPVIWAWLPEWRLQGSIGRLKQHGRGDRAELAVVWAVLHAMLGQRLLAEGDRQRLAIQPDRRRLPGQAALAVDPPVPEADVADLVQPALEAAGEGVLELFNSPVDVCALATSASSSMIRLLRSCSASSRKYLVELRCDVVPVVNHLLALRIIMEVVGVDPIVQQNRPRSRTIGSIGVRTARVQALKVSSPEL
jgi:hypothetical protein